MKKLKKGGVGEIPPNQSSDTPSNVQEKNVGVCVCQFTDADSLKKAGVGRLPKSTVVIPQTATPETKVGCACEAPAIGNTPETTKTPSVRSKSQRKKRQPAKKEDNTGLVVGLGAIAVLGAIVLGTANRA